MVITAFADKNLVGPSGTRDVSFCLFRNSEYVSIEYVLFCLFRRVILYLHIVTASYSN